VDGVGNEILKKKTSGFGAGGGYTFFARQGYSLRLQN